MRIFVTGSTGWIGSAAVAELLRSGHEVVGLARSDVSVAKLERVGAEALTGDLDDLVSLRDGSRSCDGVVHLANKHDWAHPAENNRTERAAVETILDALDGSTKPFIIANGLSGLVDSWPATEMDASPEVGPEADRGGSENLALSATTRGIRSVAMRFAPSVHGRGDWGFVNWLAAAARRTGVSGYIGDGGSAWSAVHVSDAGQLIRLALEKAPAGVRLHAVAERSISTRAIAQALGRAMNLPVTSIDPEDAPDHFGVVAHFFAETMTASNVFTRETLGWQPCGPTLVEDILAGGYSTD
ncbi:SDR family oxidoreductase [Paramicrobacterium chengjingii]|uniref:SDR family oxidoreductase n=1 Tax=Paramicrobacterium chengjingii TaxID=2769067 RepID=UPI00141DB006|nr:SDR family oxidoreductase [Microbacterium chengjingii]